MNPYGQSHPNAPVPTHRQLLPGTSQDWGWLSAHDLAAGQHLEELRAEASWHRMLRAAGFSFNWTAEVIVPARQRIGEALVRTGQWLQGRPRGSLPIGSGGMAG